MRNGFFFSEIKLVKWIKPKYVFTFSQIYSKSNNFSRIRRFLHRYHQQGLGRGLKREPTQGKVPEPRRSPERFKLSRAEPNVFKGSALFFRASNN